MLIRPRIAFVGLFVLIVASSVVAAPDKSATLEIVNESKWDIYHFYLSASDDDIWGPDQLGRDVLQTGESLTLTNIDCGVYDIKLEDEDGDECILEEVKLCNEDAVWKLTDDELLECEGFGG